MTNPSASPALVNVVPPKDAVPLKYPEIRELPLSKIVDPKETSSEVPPKFFVQTTVALESSF